MSEPIVPTLRIVRGTPTPEELAVVTAVVAAAAAASDEDRSAEPEPSRGRGRWNDPALSRRGAWLPGTGAWSASARSR